MRGGHSKVLYRRTFFILILALLNQTAFAEDKLLSSASHGLSFLAPKGIFGIKFEARSNSYDELYDSGRTKFSLGSELNNVSLNSQVLPSLVLLGSSASLGQTSLSADVSTRLNELTLGYGITDDLTLGLIVPYGKVSTKAKFKVSGGDVGFNPAFDASKAPSATNFPFAPVGGAIPSIGTEGVQDILTNPAFGFGYKPIKSTSVEELGDPTVGLLWRAHKDNVSELVFGAGIRFGLASEDDPDNLLDVPIGDGTTDLRGRVEYYRDLGNGFDLKLQLEHDIQFSDHVTKRVPQAGQFLTGFESKENLKRDMGDYWEFDVGLGKTFGNWRVASTWHLYTKEADRYHSSVGTNTDTLEADTDLFAKQLQASISWSGINAWRSGKLPMPLIVKLTVQETYDAKNFPDIRDVYLQVTSFF